MARPKKYDAEELAKQLNEYIDSAVDPQIAEFCLPLDRPTRETINTLSVNCEALSDAVKRLHAKQQIYLTRAGTNGSIPFPLAIFRLKQPIHGFKDKIEQEIKQEISVDIKLPDSMKDISE